MVRLIHSVYTEGEWRGDRGEWEIGRTEDYSLLGRETTHM